MIYFKIYGEKRTGTNYLVSCILKNFLDVDVFMNVGGWKHGIINEFPNNIDPDKKLDAFIINKINITKIIDLFKNNNINFLITIKNPYMWIYSVSIFEKKQLTSEYVISKIQLWNKHYSDYKNYIENGKAYLVKYETLLEQPTETLDKIKQKFNLTNNSVYRFERKKLRANNDGTKGKTLDVLFDRTIYTKIEPSKHLTNDIIKTINNTIDITLMNFYGYDIENI